MNFYDIILIINYTFLLVYIVIVFILYKALNNLRFPAKSNQCSVSIIVSLHNEEKNVVDLVESLIYQDYPKDQYDIILVNDRSKDRTQEMLEIAGTSNRNIKIIKIDKLQEDIAPKKFAIDTAIKQATGEIILLTDADGRPTRDWINTMLSYFSKNTGLVVGNAPYYSNTLSQKLLAMEYFSHATIAAASTGLGYPLTCVGTNMAYRREVYLELNGFGKFKNVHSGDDDLFLQRVRENTTWEIKYAVAEESQVKNAPPTSLKQFIHQRLRYASKGFKYPLKISVSLAVYYFFNVFLLLLGMLCFVNSSVFISFALILLVKGLADFCLMKKSAKTLNTKIYFIFFPIVNILHIPYVIFFGLMGNIMKYEWAGINH